MDWEYFEVPGPSRAPLFASLPSLPSVVEEESVPSSPTSFLIRSSGCSALMTCQDPEEDSLSASPLSSSSSEVTPSSDPAELCVSRAIRILCELNGVGPATSSAILCLIILSLPIAVAINHAKTLSLFTRASCSEALVERLIVNRSLPALPFCSRRLNRRHVCR